MNQKISSLTILIVISPGGHGFMPDVRLGTTEDDLCHRFHVIDSRVVGHLGAASDLKTSSIHVCLCPYLDPPGQ